MATKLHIFKQKDLSAKSTGHAAIRNTVVNTKQRSNLTSWYTVKWFPVPRCLSYRAWLRNNQCLDDAMENERLRMKICDLSEVILSNDRQTERLPCTTPSVEHANALHLPCVETSWRPKGESEKFSHSILICDWQMAFEDWFEAVTKAHSIWRGHKSHGRRQFCFAVYYSITRL